MAPLTSRALPFSLGMLKAKCSKSYSKQTNSTTKKKKKKKIKSSAVANERKKYGVV